jgi:hypothetical protein
VRVKLVIETNQPFVMGFDFKVTADRNSGSIGVTWICLFGMRFTETVCIVHGKYLVFVLRPLVLRLRA